MSPFEVPEGPFTIDKVMDSIRTQVIEPSRCAAPASADPGDKHSSESASPAPRPIVSDGGPVSRLLAQLELLRQRQSLDPGYRIQSHRPIVGPVMNFFKRLIHWGARPYIDAIRERQEAFNEAVLQALREASLQFETNISLLDHHQAYQDSFLKAIHELQAGDADLANRNNELVARVLDLGARVGDYVRLVQAHAIWLHGHDSRMAAQDEWLRTHDKHLQDDAAAIEDLLARAEALKSDLENHAGWLSALYDRYDLEPLARLATGERRLEAMDSSRGTYEDIRCRQYDYLTLFEGVPGQVLDIGCGRGEMIHMLRIHGIECWGAETDPLMVEFCNKNGDFVAHQDALSALRSVAPGSLGGIFAAQVVEHFFPGDLVRFIFLARERMARGGRLVIETLNPASLGVHAKSYWHDLEHKQMLHPEYLKGILELAGFEEVEVHTISPFNDQERLPELPPAAELGLPEAARRALQERLDKLNQLLYGMQDYYICARQGEPVTGDHAAPADAAATDETPAPAPAENPLPESEAPDA